VRGRLLLAVVAALVVAAIPAGVLSASRSDPPGGHRASIGSAVSVSLFSPSKSQSSGPGTHATKPFLSTHGPRKHVAGGAPVAPLATTQAAGPLLTQISTFPMMNFDTQVAALGIGQAVEPPDTMMAAGPTVLLETVNSNASIWTKTGTRIALADLNKALPMPTGFSFSDPRVLYDTISGRWFFTGLGFSLNHSSLVFLGVSKTNDPAGGFFVYKIAQTSNGQLHDQPKIGVNDDKVVISWDEYCCGILGTFRGAETFVFEKATLLTGSVTPVFFFGPVAAQASPVPAQSLTSTTTAYVTFNHGNFAGVLSITGTPAQNNVVVTETDLATPATSTPPLAVQPGGTIATNDDRFLSSVWQNDTLWVSGNTGCIPAGSAIVRACARLVQISTNPAPPTLIQAFDVGRDGVDAYFPAVTLDVAGNLWVALSASSASVFPAAAIVEVAAGAPAGTITAAKVFQQGAQKYGGTRWGDYSAVSIDPVTGSVWAAAEYSAAGSSHNWGTAAAQFSA
jgi:hypothetical protein